MFLHLELRHGTVDTTGGVYLRRFMDGIEILGEQIIHQSGSFKRVRRWLRGWHPGLGVLTWGWTGHETVIELDVIVPIGLINVLPENELPAA